VRPGVWLLTSAGRKAPWCVGLRSTATRCRALALVVTCVLPAAAFAGDIVIPRAWIDVSDVWRFDVGVVFPRADPGVSELSREPYERGNHPNLCGMRVVARTRQAAGDAIEWNMLFSVVTDGDTRIGGVSAGSFTRASKKASAVPRRPIAQLVFAIDGGGAPTTARATNAPHGEHGVVAEVPAAVVAQIWNALDTGTPVTVALTYDSGARETLRLRTLGTIRTQGPDWYHGRNLPAMQCLTALAPASGPGGPLWEIEHPW
jgi:hypothetical protein